MLKTVSIIFTCLFLSFTVEAEPARSDGASYATGSTSIQKLKKNITKLGSEDYIERRDAAIVIRAALKRLEALHAKGKLKGAYRTLYIGTLKKALRHRDLAIRKAARRLLRSTFFSNKFNGPANLIEGLIEFAISHPGTVRNLKRAMVAMSIFRKANFNKKRTRDVLRTHLNNMGMPNSQGKYLGSHYVWEYNPINRLRRIGYTWPNETLKTILLEPNYLYRLSPNNLFVRKHTKKPVSFHLKAPTIRIELKKGKIWVTYLLREKYVNMIARQLTYQYPYERRAIWMAKEKLLKQLKAYRKLKGEDKLYWSPFILKQQILSDGKRN